MKQYSWFARPAKLIFTQTLAYTITTCSMISAQVPAPPSASQETAPGPDTTDSVEAIGSQGNWVRKKEWLIQANDVNKEIQSLAAKDEQLRQNFIQKNNDIEKDIANFYKELSLDQGKMQEMFGSISRYLDEKRKTDIDALGFSGENKLNPELQAKASQVENETKQSTVILEQLKLDIKSIDDLNQSLIDRLKRLDEYLDNIEDEAYNAQEITDSLWKVIDHNIARDRYYELKNVILEKIKNIQSFLQDDLSKDFDAVANTLKGQFPLVQEGVKKLEDRGIFIKDRWRRIKQLLLKEAQDKKQAAGQKPAEPKQPIVAAESPTQSWSAQIYNFFGYLLKSISNTFVSIKNAIMGTSTKVPPKVAAPVEQKTATPTLPITPLAEPATSTAN